MSDRAPAEEPIVGRLSRRHSSTYGTWGGTTNWTTPLSEPATLNPVQDDPEYSHAGQAVCHECGALVTIRRPRPVSRWTLMRRRWVRSAVVVAVCATALALGVRIGRAVLGEPDGGLAFVLAMALVGFATFVVVAVVGGSILVGPPDAVADPRSARLPDSPHDCWHDASLVQPVDL
jgi:hypothetical protein